MLAFSHFYRLNTLILGQFPCFSGIFHIKPLDRPIFLNYPENLQLGGNVIPQALCSCQYRCKRGFDASRFSCRQAFGDGSPFSRGDPTESSAPLSHLHRDHRQAGISMRLPGWGKVSVLQQGESFQNMSDVRRDADRPPPNLRGNIGLLLIDTGIGAVSYTHLTLPTNSRV